MDTAEAHAGGRGQRRATDGRRTESNQPAFVLHSYLWKETSLVVELFTRGHGRLPAVAKGARRPHSALRGMLMPFQPLLVTWSGKSEVRLLRVAEWQGGVPQLQGAALICGFYLNELIFRAMARDDPHERLFDAYAEAIAHLAVAGPQGAVLRKFEQVLLAELGYALELSRDAAGAPIRADVQYLYVPERGPLPAEDGVADGAQPFVVQGQTLIDMARGQYADATTAAESKRLMRGLLRHHLGEVELQTRQLVRDLQQL
jgi:DNA repair protein RecO (recombination protein O)